jgi:WhiB family redox-sensing transcriptional regulator
MCPHCGRVEQLRRGLCHAEYERRRRAGCIDGLVPSDQARSHIVYLRVNGWRYREIARAAVMDRSQVAWIMRGRRLINIKTSRRICAVDPASRMRYYRNAWTARRRRMYDRMRDDWERRHAVRPLTPRPPAWTDDALCAQVDSELFFPEKGSNSAQYAKRVCQQCPVQTKCLDFALENDIEHGVFGGMTVKERKRLRRTRGEDTAITA